MTISNSIVFGPTGSVGSAVARRAQALGAKVSLAMRDPEKPIPGLTAAQEHEGGFERVSADLTKPETIQAAVTKTGAKHAFIYMMFGSPDNMRSSIAALKSAGIEYVVFLSGDNIKGDTRSVPPSQFLAWSHAQVEINLEEIFGVGGYVTVRATFFASNSLWWKKMIASDSEVKTVYPEAKLDWISPEDIGRVCGTLLAEGPQAVAGPETNIIRVRGPELVTQRDAVGSIGRAIGKSIKVTQLDEQEGLKTLMESNGMPEDMAKGLIALYKLRAEGTSFFEGDEEPVRNLGKYAGREPTKFSEWAEENKQAFSV
jgi:uncharacterized protein YbjT (DUF2867 family)